MDEKPKGREELQRILEGINGRGYKLYRRLKGCYAWLKYFSTWITFKAKLSPLPAG